MQQRNNRKEYRRRLSLLLVVAMVVMLLENVTGGTPAKASGTAPDITNITFDNADTANSGSPDIPLRISSDIQLYYLANLIENKETNPNYENKPYAECSYQLTQDVTISYNAWKPIGNSSTPFLGTFDGQGHTVSGINITNDTLVVPSSIYNSDNICLGMFGNIGAGTIENLTITSSTLTKPSSGNWYNCLGLLAGNIGDSGNVTIQNCHTGGTVEVASTASYSYSTDFDALSGWDFCSKMVGGMIGGITKNSSNRTITIEGCTNSASVTADGVKYVGGIIGGITYGSITNCTNSGAITANREVGGIAGKAGMNTSIANCNNQGNITALDYSSEIWDEFSRDTCCSTSVSDYAPGYYVGGITGYNYKEILSSKNSGTITGNSNVGGIAGFNKYYVGESSNRGTITTSGSYSEHTITSPGVPLTFQSEGKNIGGISGNSISDGSVITDCINQASVTGKENVGGILGNLEETDSSGKLVVQYSYNTGTVLAAEEALCGGLIGTGQSTQNSYYLANLTPQEEDNGDNNGTQEKKSAREFSSGEVCYYLEHDGNGARNIWSQILGSDSYPSLIQETLTESSVYQIKLSDIQSDTTYTTYKYCNNNDTVKKAANITTVAGYTYHYYLVGSSITDLTEIPETQEITGDCHIAVKKVAVVIPSTPTPSTPTPTVAPTATPEPTPTVTPTDTPDSTPAATPVVPVFTPSPTPTVAPTDTPEPSVSPTTEPHVTKAPSATPVPGTVGSTVVKDKTEYQMTGKNTARVNKIIGVKTNVKIPATIAIGGNKLKVTAIADNTFLNNKKIKQVTVGKNIIKIGTKAFKNCKNLKKITFSGQTTTVGTQCFANCTNLKSISLPNGMKTIGKEAFKNCTGLKAVKIGKTPKKSAGALPDTGGGTQKVKAGKLELKISVGNGAFENCKSLRSVIINTQVRVIGNSAFKNCKSLASIIVRSLILKTVGKKALTGVSNCKISVPQKKFTPYRKLFKNKGQGKKVFVAKV